MKYLRGLFWLLAIVAILTLLAVYVQADRIRDDLVSRVESTLIGNNIDWADVEIDGRDVVLTGESPIEKLKPVAIELVRKTRGVRIVSSRLEVAEPVSPYVWSAESKGKQIILQGWMPDPANLAIVTEKAAERFPGYEIDSRMRLADGKDGIPDDGWTGAALFALDNLALLKQGKVRLSDFTLVIEGAARDERGYQAISEAFRGGAGAPDGYILSNRITLPVVLPYRMVITLEKKTIHLDGFAPDEGSRRHVIETVSRLWPDRSVTGRVRMAAGAPEGWNDAVGFALSELQQLETGTVSLVDAKLSVIGTAKSSASYAAVMRARERDNFHVALEVIPPPVSPYVWTARRQNDAVELTGFVPDTGRRKQILDKLNTLLPELKITDNLRYGSGAPPGWMKRIDFSLQQLARLEKGEITLTGGKLDIRGVAASNADYDRLIRLTPPAHGLASPVSVSRPVPELFYWAAERRGGALRLSGYVEDETLRQLITGRARALAPGMTVEDKMSLAGGQPGQWKTALVLALEQLALLKEGTVRVERQSMAVSGMARDSEAYRKLTSAGAPDGMSMNTSQVRPPAVETPTENKPAPEMPAPEIKSQNQN